MKYAKEGKIFSCFTYDRINIWRVRNHVTPTEYSIKNILFFHIFMRKFICTFFRSIRFVLSFFLYKILKICMNYIGIYMVERIGFIKLNFLNTNIWNSLF